MQLKEKSAALMSASLLVWGTYDIGKPRVRILIQGLNDVGVDVLECHANLWAGVEDKSQMRGVAVKMARVLRWLTAYPRLIYCLFRRPRRDTLLVPYMGHVDVLVLWPFARLRGSRIIWDAFLSIYSTIVEDRQLLSPRSPLAWGLYALEWLATRAADRIVLDTEAHSDYFARRYGVAREKLASVIVGVEQQRFPPAPPMRRKSPDEPMRVLFYGQFIPLHGIPTIIRAARQLDDGSVEWMLIGRGQEDALVRRLLTEQPIRNLSWTPWVPYENLAHEIGAADVCLGIFSASDKAARVIPNKVFQVLSVGRPIITRESPALRELFPNGANGLYVVPPEDPDALVAAIKEARRNHDRLASRPLFEALRSSISSSGVGAEFRGKLLDGV
jgi:glycosyltransferase involved in cell wall biosynthesis